MKKVLLTSGFAIVCGFLIGNTSVSANTTITVTNNSSGPIISVQSTNRDHYMSNNLLDESILPGGSQDVDIDDSGDCHVHMFAHLRGNRVAEIHRFDVCTHDEWEITD